ncbi:MAG: YqzL family protein [Candidatus Alkaliphilus sp. MAG34]|nr:YqzL family protein [Clostridiales bacterium]
MLDKIMWNIFEETGNIYAYLYVKECNENLEGFNEYCYNKNRKDSVYTGIENPSEANGITIMT